MTRQGTFSWQEALLSLGRSWRDCVCVGKSREGGENTEAGL